MDTARKAAATAITRLHNGGWANLSLKTALSGNNLSVQEKAFATAIFYGTAERIATLDFLLLPFLSKPITKLDAEVRAVLETGLYQIKYMDLPVHAVVNEMVSVVRGLKKTSAAGFVNAVLRKASSAELPEKFDNELQRISVLYSVSQELAAEFVRIFPNDYEKLLQHFFNKKELCVRVNILKITADKLAELFERDGFLVRHGGAPNSLYMDFKGDITSSDLYRQGMFHVQGESSQYACAAVGAQSGDKVLDLCAAPGGKSATLAQYIGGGAGLISCELRENRLPLIKKLLERLEIKGAKIFQNDAVVYDSTLENYDKVLCDVPCSGLGVIASKPDLRYTDGSVFKSLEQLQRQILQTAARYVKTCGKLVYSTCTIRPEENEDVIEEFLKQNKDFKIAKSNFVVKNATNSDFGATFLPHTTNLDGFFVATLERL